MSCGLRWPSPSLSTPTTAQVEGASCIGPTGRSNRRVAVEAAGVAVGDPLAVGAASGLPANFGRMHAALVELAPAGGAVAGDHLTDRGQERPLEVALLVGLRRGRRRRAGRPPAPRPGSASSRGPSAATSAMSGMPTGTSSISTGGASGGSSAGGVDVVGGAAAAGSSWRCGRRS